MPDGYLDRCADWFDIGYSAAADCHSLAGDVNAHTAEEAALEAIMKHMDGGESTE